jgi:hypothetical protein
LRARYTRPPFVEAELAGGAERGVVVEQRVVVAGGGSTSEMSFIFSSAAEASIWSLVAP